jgi:hypothetical protein
MKCNQVQLTLPDYRDKTLTTEQSQLIEEHLASCPECAEYFLQEKEFAVLLREATADMESSLQFHCRPGSLDRQLEPVERPFPRVQVKWVAAMAVLGILFCGALLLYKPASPPQVPVNQVAGALPRIEGGNTIIKPDTRNERMVQIITIEDGSGRLTNTYYLQEEDGVTVEISVKVTAIRLANKNNG